MIRCSHDYDTLLTWLWYIAHMTMIHCSHDYDTLLTWLWYTAHMTMIHCSHDYDTLLTWLWYVAHMTLEVQDTLPPSHYRGPWWHTSSGKRAGPILIFHRSHTSTNLHADKNTLCLAWFSRAPGTRLTLCLAGLHTISCRWVFCVINHPGVMPSLCTKYALLA